MTDDLEVRIGRLQGFRTEWLASAEALTVPLQVTEWNPYTMVTSTPAMPAGLQLLIQDTMLATAQLRQALRNGSDACVAAAEAVGVAAGMYAEQEETAIGLVNTIGAPLEERPI